MDTLTANLDEGNFIFAAFLDLKKVFDSFDHCILLQRLSSLELSNSTMQWFQNYHFSFHLGEQ